MTVVWLVVFGVMLAVEAMTLGLTTIWFAGGALITFFLSLVNDNPIVQCTVFLAVSLVCLLLLRPTFVKKFNQKRVKTNVDSLIGLKAKVTQDISNPDAVGTVILRGMEWTARSTNDEVIPAGSRVMVKEVQGVKLIVERVNPEDRKKEGV